MELEDTVDEYESEADLKDEFGNEDEGLYAKAKGAVTAKAGEIKTGIGERIKEEKEYRAYTKKKDDEYKAYKKEQSKEERADFPTRYAKEQAKKAASKVKRAERRVAIKKTARKTITGLAKKMKEADTGGGMSMGFDPISPQKARVTRQQTPSKQPTFELGIAGGAVKGFEMFGAKKGKKKPLGMFEVRSGGFDIFGTGQKKKKGKRKEFSLF